MRTVLFLTSVYPYGSAETFIENEIDVLCKHADRVIILVCGAKKGDTMRPTPKNVRIVTAYSKPRWYDLAKFPLYLARPGDVLGKELKEVCKGAAQKAFACYFESKCRRVYNSLRRQLDIKELSGDEVVIYSYWLFATARVGTMLMNDLGKSVKHSFTRAHSYDLYEFRMKHGYLPMRHNLLASYDEIRPCSEDGAEHLKGLYPEYADKCRAAYLGTVDHGCGKPSSDGTFRILSCSRMAEEKRLDKLVRALLACERDGYTNIEWTHIGGGELETEIKELAGRLLRTTVCNFKGNVSNRDVISYYQNNPVDLFVNVSSGEGLPVSIMEAISFGIPAIATDVGGTREIVSDNLTGVLLPENFSDDRFVMEFGKFYHSSEKERARMRESARAEWERLFRANTNYERFYAEMEM